MGPIVVSTVGCSSAMSQPVMAMDCDGAPPTGTKLDVRVIFAMPLGPPFGGMTEYARMLRSSKLFERANAVVFDTTPPNWSYTRISRFIHFLRNTRRLAGLMRQHRPHVIYLMTSGYLGFYEKAFWGVASGLMGVKWILHPVGSFANFYGSTMIGRPVIRTLLSGADAVMTVERQTKAMVERVARDATVWLVPNPVDSNSYSDRSALASTAGDVRILFLSALLEAKGILDLLAAMSQYKVELERVQLVVVGSGPLHDECLRRIHELGIGESVSLAGFVDDQEKRRLLESSDIFCLPSYSEGTPIAMLEAMASGLPVVVTDVGGIPFVVQDGNQGYLVKPGDIAQLGKRLVQLAADEPERRKMGSAGRLRVRQSFDIAIVAEMFAERLNSLTRRAGSLDGVVDRPTIGPQ
jgi:glycosyltransferase involved in cell wall biosynthesis